MAASVWSALDECSRLVAFLPPWNMAKAIRVLTPPPSFVSCTTLAEQPWWSEARDRLHFPPSIWSFAGHFLTALHSVG